MEIFPLNIADGLHITDDVQTSFVISKLLNYIN